MSKYYHEFIQKNPGYNKTYLRSYYIKRPFVNGWYTLKTRLVSTDFTYEKYCRLRILKKIKTKTEDEIKEFKKLKSQMLKAQGKMTMENTEEIIKEINSLKSQIQANRKKFPFKKGVVISVNEVLDSYLSKIEKIERLVKNAKS